MACRARALELAPFIQLFADEGEAWMQDSETMRHIPCSTKFWLIMTQIRYAGHLVESLNRHCTL